jgi:tetratricopeptide (TPR) repeat protein
MLPVQPVDLRRRQFLLQSCRGASAAIVAACLRPLAFSRTHALSRNASGTDFYLNPHYRVRTPLDELLLQTTPGQDEFASEVHVERIGKVLSEWSAALQQSPADLKSIAENLALGFKGPSLLPAQSRVVRPGSSLEVRQVEFPSEETALSREAFLGTLQASLKDLTLTVADFDVVGLEASGGSNADARIKTRVRYQLAGSSHGIHREQRIGYWDLQWERTASGEYRVVGWQAHSETRSLARSPIFADITESAFAASPSYAAQLCKGTDYWRTVLDAACGIDIYGHNGISVGDIDGDGYDDLYVCQPAGLPNRLYRNRGDGTFEDITEASGAGLLDNTACALFVDVDNDGRQDLIVVRTTGPLLFLNQGGGRFKQKADAFKFATPPQGTFTGAAAADYDRDGWLDIYFCLYVYYQGTDQYKYPLPYYSAENGPPNFLFRNQRDGTFRDVTTQTGLQKNNTRYSFCCGWSDFNGDGWPDLYVVNDFGRKNLYRNNKDGTFTDAAAAAGVEDIGAGMGVCWLDYDNDGAQDLYVADMWTAAGERVSMQDDFQKEMPESIRALYRKHARGNSLFRNRGDGTFQDTSAAAGVEMGRWSWSADTWDFDHDGFSDLYVANGMVSGPKREDLNSFFWRRVVARSPQEAKPSHEYEQGWTALNELLRSDYSWSGFERNVFFANNRDGTFSDVSACVGLDFLEDGRSFALADLDHDGRLEVVLKNRNAPQLRLLKNIMPELAPSITFRLTGSKSNHDAIGASVTVITDSGKQTRMVQAGSGFLSQHSKELHFGLGDAEGPVRASIRWPNGLVQNLDGLPPNHQIQVQEGIEGFHSDPFRKSEAPNNPPKRQGTEALPTTAETWLLTPVAAPDFSLPDLSGKTYTLSALRGRTVLLSFVSSQSPTWRDDLKATDQVAKLGSKQNLEVLAINFAGSAEVAKTTEALRSLGISMPILQGNDDVAGVYSVLYRYLFDRHRDIPLPTAFLLNAAGDIVKVLQGPLNPQQAEQDCRQIPATPSQRLAKALPFQGIIDSLEFPRNSLSFGSAYFQRRYFDQAEASFQQALRDNPESAEAEYGLGSVYLKQSKLAEARARFLRATQRSASYPDTLPDAWNNLGLIATRESRMTDAIEYFKKSLELSPDHMVALVNLGNAYRQQRRWDDARAVFERATTAVPQDPEANYGLAMVYAQLNDTSHAYEYLQKALVLRPAYPEALNNLGILYLRTEQRDKAVASFEECIHAAPEFNQAYLNLARVYALEGASENARTVLLQLLVQHPDDAQAKAALAQLPQ